MLVYAVVVDHQVDVEISSNRCFNLAQTAQKLLMAVPWLGLGWLITSPVARLNSSGDMVVGHLEKLAMEWSWAPSTPVAAVGLAGQPAQNSNFSRCPVSLSLDPSNKSSVDADDQGSCQSADQSSFALGQESPRSSAPFAEFQVDVEAALSMGLSP